MPKASDREWKLKQVWVKTYADECGAPRVDLKLALQLGRISNALRTWYRVTFLLDHGGAALNAFATVKSKIDVPLQLAAVLKESLKSLVLEMHEPLSTFQLQSRDRTELNRWKERFYDVDDQFVQLLKSFRNDVMFHFKSSLVVEQWPKLPFQEMMLFSAGESDTIFDIVHLMSEELVHQFIKEKAPGHGSASETVQWFTNTVFQAAMEVGDLADRIIGTILKPRAVIKEGPM